MWLVLAFCILSLATGNVTIFLHGYGVDSSENLYIGLEREIIILQGGNMIGSINTRVTPSKAYRFSVLPNDTIIISNSSQVYVMNSCGELIGEYEDVNSQNFSRMRCPKKITSRNGIQYSLKNYFGRTSIVSGENQIEYKMPLLDAIVKISLFTAIGFAVLMILMLIRNNSIFINSTSDGFRKNNHPTL